MKRGKRLLKAVSEKPLQARREIRAKEEEKASCEAQKGMDESPSFSRWVSRWNGLKTEPVTTIT